MEEEVKIDKTPGAGMEESPKNVEKTDFAILFIKNGGNLLQNAFYNCIIVRCVNMQKIPLEVAISVSESP